MRHKGERYGGVRDRSVNTWWITTHVADVPADEEGRRIGDWPNLTGDT